MKKYQNNILKVFIGNKMITNCDAKELEIMALIDREFLNGIPTDQKYNKAIEEILYNELRIVLDLSFEDTKEYIINIFEELLKES